MCLGGLIAQTGALRGRDHRVFKRRHNLKGLAHLKAACSFGVAAKCSALAGDVFVYKFNAPSAGFNRTPKQVENRGFACSFRLENPQRPALFDLVDLIVDHCDGAERPFEVFWFQVCSDMDFRRAGQAAADNRT